PLDVNPRSVNLEGGVGFLEGGRIGCPQAKELEQLQQDRQVVHLAAGNIDGAAPLEAIDVGPPAREIEPGGHRSADLILAPEVVLAELLQLDLQGCQVHVIAQRRTKLDPRSAAEIAAKEPGLQVRQAENLRGVARNIDMAVQVAERLMEDAHLID